MRLEPVAPAAPLPAVERRKFSIAALNGTAIYIIAYYVVWGLHEAAKFGASHYFHLRGRIDPSRITYTLADGEWWRMAIIGTYGIGPLTCLLLGIIAFRRYWRHERAYRGQYKLLLLWVTFHGCNAFFGALLGDTLTQSGFWFVSEWMFLLGSAVNVLLAILAGLVQLTLGYFAAAAFLQAHDSITVMRYEYRAKMVLSTLIVPWAVGGVFIGLTKLPYFSLQEGMHLFVMGLLVTPLALGCRNDVFSDTIARPQPTHVSWGLVIFAVVIAGLWRLLLSPPIAFG